MVRITDEATAILEAIDRPEGRVLRLEPVEPSSLGIVLGESQPDDIVVERQGSDLLHMSAAVSELLSGLVIDRVDTPEGPRLGLASRSGAEQPGPNGTGPE
jgi:hypothetical protein